MGLMEDISIEKDTTQMGFWMPQTRGRACQNVTVRNLRVEGSWADGVNIHGSHSDVLIADSIIKNTGDDGLAVWSRLGDIERITFRNNSVENPRYPANSDGQTVSCFAVYGGTSTTFIDNRCIGTGSKG